MPIRVLHVVTYMGRGGLETMLMNYYRHIDRDKVQFDFLVHRDFEADYDQEILALGGKIYHLPPLNPIGREYLLQLEAFFAEHREYKIVHCHLDCMAGIPLRMAKKYDVPIRIAHAHNSNQIKNTKYLLKLFYRGIIPKYATKLFACGDKAGTWMFRTKKFKVLNNAIDAKQYVYSSTVAAEVREMLGILPDELVCGHVGRFMTQKNHDFLLRVFAQMPDYTKLLLVGDGELRKPMEKLAEELGVRNRVLFMGIRDDVNRLLQAMDVFVFPSLFEGLPVSVIEAQAAGVPCILSDQVSRESKLVDEVEFLSLNESTEAWVQHILRYQPGSKANTYGIICDAGYDIVKNAEWLQNFYLTEGKR